MKGLLFVFGFLVCACALFLGVLRWGVSNGAKDDIALTRTPSEVVLDDAAFELNRRSSRHRGYRVTYRYRFDQRWYSGDEWVPELTWEPQNGGHPLLCVNPDDPAEHIVARRPNAQCGDDNTGGADVQRAEPASAPARSG